MYGPLKQIEEINSRSRIRLAEILSRKHSVRLATRDSDSSAGYIGAAFFFAFDPWHTCLRIPSGSFRYFTMAAQKGLISRGEMDDLFKTLLTQSADARRRYKGYFKNYFDRSAVKNITTRYYQLNSLVETGLDLDISSADILFESCPWPVIARKHLQTQLFGDVSISNDLNYYSSSDWLAWTEALDITCLGPWFGFSKAELESAIGNLFGDKVEDLHGPSPDLVGQKVVIPLFDQGFQGIVVGFFRDVPAKEQSSIISTLSQFGQTLADAYSSARVAEFKQMANSTVDDDTLLQGIIKAISPVSKVLLEKDGRRSGYSLYNEGEYWAGYRILSDEEISDGILSVRFCFRTQNGARIFVEPLHGLADVDEEFAEMRLESLLNLFFKSSTANEHGLSLEWVRELRSEYQPYSDDRSASLAKLRQYYVVSKVEQHWQEGSVKITNNELKRFFEGLGRDAKNGYQVTSFASEFEKIFTDRVTATKTRNALSLSWDKGS